MTQLKTQPTVQSVEHFIEGVVPDAKRQDCQTLLTLFTEATEYKPVMWGESIIGFGRYHYKNTKGQYEWLITGFSPRKQNLTIYIMQGFDNFTDELSVLGKVKHAKSCLYVNKLSDINLDALRRLIKAATNDMKTRYDCSE